MIAPVQTRNMASIFDYFKKDGEKEPQENSKVEPKPKEEEISYEKEVDMDP